MKYCGVTIQMQATEQHFPVVLFLSLWMKSCGVTIQMQATEQHFPMVLDIMLYSMGLPFESMDEILKCAHAKKHRQQYFQSQSLDLNISSWYSRK